MTRMWLLFGGCCWLNGRLSRGFTCLQNSEDLAFLEPHPIGQQLKSDPPLAQAGSFLGGPTRSSFCCHLSRHLDCSFSCIKTLFQASVMDQRWRTHLLMQETWVRSLAWEDSTCLGATKPLWPNYWAWALEARDFSLHTPEPVSPVGEASSLRNSGT